MMHTMQPHMWLRSYKDEHNEGVWRLQYVIDNGRGYATFGSTLGNSMTPDTLSEDETVILEEDGAVEIDDEGFFWHQKSDVESALRRLSTVNEESVLFTWLEIPGSDS